MKSTMGYYWTGWDASGIKIEFRRLRDRPLGPKAASGAYPLDQIQG